MPRIVIERELNSYNVKKYYIATLENIWNTYEPTESLFVVIAELYAYYFLLNIVYSEVFEIILGFFHEALEIQTPVVFAKKKVLRTTNS